MNGATITVSLKMDEARATALRNGMEPDDGAKIISAIDGGIIDSGHFRNTWEERVGGWKPLSPKWEKWKVQHGYEPDKWTMTGATMRALTTRVPVGPAGGSIDSRIVTITENGGGRVRAIWKIVRPAARGYFWKNNIARPWLDEIKPGTPAYELVIVRVKAAVGRIWRRVKNA